MTILACPAWVPSHGGEATQPIQATLVINLDAKPIAEILLEADLGDDAETPDEDRPLLVTNAMHYPFRLVMRNFKVHEKDLRESTLGQGRPLNLSIAFEGGADRREPYRVQLGTYRKTANLFTLLAKYSIHQEQLAYRSGSTFNRLFRTPYLLSEAALQACIARIASLNCYTFAHYVHFSNTMGLWPYFDQARWMEIASNDLAFGDLVRLATTNAGDHFMLYLGRGLYLSKLGSTNDLIITDLENIQKLYSVHREETSEVTAYRARN